MKPLYGYLGVVCGTETASYKKPWTSSRMVVERSGNQLQGKELMGYCGGSAGGQGPSTLVMSVSSSPGYVCASLPVENRTDSNSWRLAVSYIPGIGSVTRGLLHSQLFSLLTTCVYYCPGHEGQESKKFFALGRALGFSHFIHFLSYKAK